MIRLLLVAAILVTFVRPAGAEPAEDLQGLRALMADRLAVMEYVAAFKWNEGLPIDDKAREAKVVRETLARNNIDSDDAAQVTRALKAQIEAAKLVQRALFREWQAANKDKGGRNVKKTAVRSLKEKRADKKLKRSGSGRDQK